MIRVFGRTPPPRTPLYRSVVEKLADCYIDGRATQRKHYLFDGSDISVHAVVRKNQMHAMYIISSSQSVFFEVKYLLSSAKG